MRYSALFLVVLFLSSCHFDANEPMVNQSIEGVNPSGRQQYWRSRFGGKPNHKAFRKGEKAIRKQLKSQKNTYRDGGIMKWEELGPSNIGGRIRAIAVQPSDEDVILIGAAAGGLWKSSDGGDSWGLKTPYFSSYPVSSIAYDPFDETIIYATTGEFRGGGPEFPGVGMLKSSDAGETWTNLPHPVGNDSLWLSKLAMNPLKPNSFYVGGSNTGTPNQLTGGSLYRTDDGGQSWTIVVDTSQVANLGANISDIAIDPQDTSHIVIGTNTNAWESFDSGLNWVSIFTSSNIPPLAANDSGGRCEVEMTEVAGVTYITLSRYASLGSGTATHSSDLWQSISGSGIYTGLVNLQEDVSDKKLLPFGSQGQYDQVIWVDPNDQNRIIWGGLDMWKYDNGTNTRISHWVSDIDGSTPAGGDNSIHADQHVITPSSSYNGASNNKVWIGNDGGIYGTDNIWTATDSTGWYAKNDGLNITQLYGADLSYNGKVSAGGAQDNSYFYNNTSNTSTNYDQPSTGDGGKCRIHKGNNDILYVSTQKGNIHKSIDGGSNFCKILNLDANSTQILSNSCGGNLSLYVQSNVQFIVPVELSPADSDIVFVGGANLFKSEDQGENWDIIKLAINGAGISALSVSEQDDDIICIGTNTGRVELTTDGGLNWSLIANGLDLSQLVYTITDIAINPQNSNHILVSLGKPGNPQDGISNGNLWLTTDGGNNWVDVSPDELMHIETVLWHPTLSNWIYIGTNVGISSSEDLGATWNITPLISENSDGPVLSLVTEMFWQGDGSDATPYYLCASTHGRGLWRTKFPVRKTHYVDKDCSPCGAGSFDSPYKYFKNAVAAAGSGCTIIFKTGGTYDEVPSSIFTNDRIKIQLMDATVAPVLVK